MIARKREYFALPSMLEASVLLYLQGAIIMTPNGVRKSDQVKLIMKCLRSRLSDYQWCHNQGINPGTFITESANRAKQDILFSILQTELLPFL